MPADTPDCQSSFCSVGSLQAGETLYGTAPQVETYLLLEYNGAWGSQAIPQSNLPPAVKARLAAYSEELPNTKALLLKSRSGVVKPGYSFFVAQVGIPHPRLFAFELDAYEALLNLDIPAMLVGNPAYDGNCQEASLILVCTNGRRDLCCAKFGLPVYQELVRLAGEAVWQSTHFGGHRFAPNVLCLPSGLMYGRIPVEGAGALLTAAGNGQVHLNHYRGRTAYPPPVQAAEYFLRRQTGVLDLGAFTWLQAKETGKLCWSVEFAGASGAVYQIQVERPVGMEMIYESCEAEEPSPVKNYQLLAYDVKETN